MIKAAHRCAGARMRLETALSPASPGTRRNTFQKQEEANNGRNATADA
jgi:hypothetical protein